MIPLTVSTTEMTHRAVTPVTSGRLSSQFHLRGQGSPLRSCRRAILVWFTMSRLRHGPGSASLPSPP